MKQIISVLLILLCVCVFAQEGDRQEPRPEGMRGRQNRMSTPDRMNGMPRQMGLIFGIPYSEYEKLGISEEVQTKIDGLQKEYNEKYMRRPDMRQRRGDRKKNSEEDIAEQKEEPKKFTEEEIAKQREEAKKAEEKLYADFKALLTPEQLKAYETAFEEQIENYRQAITKEYNALNEKLKFTEEQNKKIFDFINEFKGNPAEFYQGFIKLLDNIMTEEQKTAYQTYQKEKMEEMRKQMNRQGGNKRQGNRPPERQKTEKQ